MSKWSVPIERIAANAAADVEQVVRKATFDLFRAVISKSPVDTGRFRANWNVSAEAPNYTFGDSVDQGRTTSETAKALTLAAGGVVFLSNGLPYANRLEFGYSQQAPAGMIRTSVFEFNRFVDKALA